MMYAIIEIGGKQYKVEPGIKIKAEKINGSIGEEVKFDKILLINDQEKIFTGNPFVSDALVSGEITKQDRDKKVIVYKRRPKKGYRKTIGHRQYFTEVKIKEIKLSADVSG